MHLAETTAFRRQAVPDGAQERKPRINAKAGVFPEPAVDQTLRAMFSQKKIAARR
ncbi:MAG: hypothetical protein LBG29_07105 [Synergistaceae bacterium]|jgi:hypothetical protein|nr:hypothetical protein [Synergistaceae bacterium]